MNTSLSILQWSSQYSFDPLKKHATGRSSEKNYLRLQNWWPLQRHLKRGSSQWLEDRRRAWNSSLLIYPNDLITTDSLFLLILTKTAFPPLITSFFILLCCQEKIFSINSNDCSLVMACWKRNNNKGTPYEKLSIATTRISCLSCGVNLYGVFPHFFRRHFLGMQQPSLYRGDIKTQNLSIM